jgi:hypothetical protein
MYSQTAVVIVSDLLWRTRLQRTLSSAQAKQKRDTPRSKDPFGLHLSRYPSSLKLGDGCRDLRQLGRESPAGPDILVGDRKSTPPLLCPKRTLGESGRDLEETALGESRHHGTRFLQMRETPWDVTRTTRNFGRLNRPDSRRASSWHFATRLLPELRPTVAEGGKGWQDGRVVSYLNG